MTRQALSLLSTGPLPLGPMDGRAEWCLELSASWRLRVRELDASIRLRAPRNSPRGPVVDAARFAASDEKPIVCMRARRPLRPLAPCSFASRVRRGTGARTHIHREARVTEMNGEH